MELCEHGVFVYRSAVDYTNSGLHFRDDHLSCHHVYERRHRGQALYRQPGGQGLLRAGYMLFQFDRIPRLWISLDGISFG